MEIDSMHPILGPEKHARSQVAFQVPMNSFIFPAAFCWPGKIKAAGSTLLSVTCSSHAAFKMQPVAPLRCPSWSHHCLLIYTPLTPPAVLLLYQIAISLTLGCCAHLFVLHLVLKAIPSFFRKQNDLWPHDTE